MRHTVEEKKRALQECLENFLKQVGELEILIEAIKETRTKDIDELKRFIRKTLEGVKKETVSIAFAGEYNAGKTSLINAIFGINLPTGPIPTTDRVYHILYGEDEEEKVIGDEVYLYLPEPLLQGFEIIDMPGTNSIYKEHTEKAKDVILNSNFAVFVVGSTQVMSASQSEHMEYIRQKGTDFLAYVINAVDHLSEEERRKILEYVKTGLNSIGMSDVKIVMTSTKTGEGLEELKRIIFEAFEDKMQKKLRNIENEKINAIWKDLLSLAGQYRSKAEEKAEEYEWLRESAKRSIQNAERAKNKCMQNVADHIRLAKDLVKSKMKEFTKPSLASAVPVVGRLITSRRREELEKAIEEIAKEPVEKMRGELDWLEGEYKRIVEELRDKINITRTVADKTKLQEKLDNVSEELGRLYENISESVRSKIQNSASLGAIAGGVVGAGAGGLAGAVGNVALLEPTTALFVGIPLGAILGVFWGSRKAKKAQKEAEKKIEEYFQELEKLYRETVDEYTEYLMRELKNVHEEMEQLYRATRSLEEFHERLREAKPCWV